MTHARQSLISLDDTPYYHCVSRCVRRAFLWGRDSFSGRNYSHRKRWIIERLATLQDTFAIRLCAYAVMSDHYHVVLRVERGRARGWSVDEVIERWSQIFRLPPVVLKLRSSEAITKAERAEASAVVEIWRLRLHDVSWFMRCLNEHLARRANGEDRCQGRFWEGRFKSQALLDEAGLLTCMSYVDLNPIRAGIATTPEDSAYTSIYERIRFAFGTARGIGKIRGHVFPRRPREHFPLFPFLTSEKRDGASLPFRLNDYLALVDWTGRAIREDKRGHIPHDLPPILARLGIDPRHWLMQMQRRSKRFGRAIGRSNALIAHARNIGQMWIKGLGLSQQLFPEGRT